ncbi:MAG: outer membrane beta-barrel protein [Oligoflexales bacterium]
MLARVIIATCVLMISHPSFALIDASVVAGQKIVTLNDGDGDLGDLGGTSVTASVHVHPFKLIPIGLGLFMASETTKGEDTDKTFDITTSGQAGGVELNAWAPIPFVKPFLKAGYVLFGKSKMEIDLKTAFETELGISKVTYDGAVKGYRVAVGFEWNPIPKLGIILQYQTVNEEQTFKKGKFELPDGTTTETDLEEEFKPTFTGQIIGLGLGFRF